MNFSRIKLKLWTLSVLLAISGSHFFAQKSYGHNQRTEHARSCQQPQINSMSMVKTRVDNGKIFYTLGVDVTNLRANSFAVITVTVDNDLQHESQVNHNGYFDFEISAPYIAGGDFYVACELYNQRQRLVDADGCVVVIEGP